MTEPIPENEIFVFGSNLAGRHGKGSALEARLRYGAILGVGEGPTGRAYAIPTKDHSLRVLPLWSIECAVHKFLAYARNNSDLSFLVAKIGCLNAGYEEFQISPFFRGAPANVILPKGWREYAEAYRWVG